LAEAGHGSKWQSDPPSLFATVHLHDQPINYVKGGQESMMVEEWTRPHGQCAGLQPSWLAYSYRSYGEPDGLSRVVRGRKMGRADNVKT